MGKGKAKEAVSRVPPLSDSLLTAIGFLRDYVSALPEPAAGRPHAAGGDDSTDDSAAANTRMDTRQQLACARDEVLRLRAQVEALEPALRTSV